jgi:hypothetical protein
MAGLGRDPLEPAAYRRIGMQVEPAPPARTQKRATAIYGSWLYCSKNTEHHPSLELPAFVSP